jgi:hypothetical protein
MSLTRNGKQGNEVIRSVKIESSVHEGVRFRGCTATVGAYDFGANPVHIDLTLIWYGGGGRVERVVKDVCSGLPLTQLRVLIIEDIVMQDKSWAEAFGGLAKLHTIRVRGRPLQELVRALDVTHAGARQCNKVKGFPSGDVLFPRLHKLVMDETKFRISFGDGTLDDLMDMLMGRSERRVEVRELHLSNCVRLYEPDVELLKELVVDVFWDGVIEDEYSDDDEYSEEHLEYGGHGFFGPIYYPTSSYSQSDDDLIEPPNLGP